MDHYKNLEEIAEKIDKDKDFRKAVISKLGITEEFVREYIVNFIKNIFGYEGIEGYRVVFSWRDNSGILEKKPTITLGEFLREDNGIFEVTYTDIGLICHDFTYGEDLASEVRNDFSNLEFEAYKKTMKERYSDLSEKEIKVIYGMLDVCFWKDTEMEFFNVCENTGLKEEQIVDILDGR